MRPSSEESPLPAQRRSRQTERNHHALALLVRLTSFRQWNRSYQSERSVASAASGARILYLYLVLRGCVSVGAAR